jgi:hypothetical protein
LISSKRILFEGSIAKVWRLDARHLAEGSSPEHANDGECGILHTRFLQVELGDVLFHHLESGEF